MVERIQPLAVTFVDATVAPYLMQHAKLLRQSVNINVRQKVFINSDMMRDESQVAYDLQVQRRQREHNQQTTTHKSHVVQPANHPSSTMRHHYAAQHSYCDEAYPVVVPETSSSAVGDAQSVDIVGVGGCIGVGSFGVVRYISMAQCSASIEESSPSTCQTAPVLLCYYLWSSMTQLTFETSTDRRDFPLQIALIGFTAHHSQQCNSQCSHLCVN